MPHRLSPLAALTLLALAAPAAGAQGVPTSQPSLITIVREEVKVGRAAEHEKIEAGWPAAYEKARSPYNYLALASLTGSSEAWFVSTYASHAAIEDGMKREEAEPLASELSRLSRADGDVLTGLRVIQARARPDLSYGAFPNIAKMRFWEVSTFRVRPGHEAQFEAAAKAFIAASKRATPGTSFRTYEVIAGGPGPTYLIFASVASYAEFDKAMADGDKAMGAFTPEEGAAMGKFFTEGAISAETQRFRLSAAMSYVNKETKDQDPAFWNPKKSAPKKPAGQP